MRLNTLFLASALALGLSPFAAFAKEREPRSSPGHAKPISKDDALGDYSPEEAKCVQKCQEPMVKCVKKCGQNASCMEGCSKDLGQCINGCDGGKSAQ